MIKAVLSDFDGTLVDNNGNFDPLVHNLIKQIQSKGVRFSIATGRAHMGRVGASITDLGIDGYHIFNGGALILDTLTNKKLWYQPISAESAKKIIPYLQKQKLVFVAETLDAGYESGIIDLPPFMKGSVVKPIAELSDMSGIVKIMIIAFANALNETQIQSYIKEIEESVKDVTFITFQYNGKGGFDITSELSTKHTAVLEYMRLLNLKKEEIIAIGNDFNDYPMFTAAGYSIAMPDSPKELKEIASFVVKEEGGVVPALQHILNLR